MDNRETLYLDFQNINNAEVGHSMYAEPIFSNDEFQVFECHESKAADNYGILDKTKSVRYFHIAIKNNGIPYLFDMETQKMVAGPLSEMECRLDGTTYTEWRGKTA